MGVNNLTEMHPSGRLAVLVFVLVAAFAVFVDVTRLWVQPITILTIALVGVTGYYAWQDQRMASAMDKQVSATREVDRERQRETQILNVHPLLISEPGNFDLDISNRFLRVPLPIGEDPVLNLTVMVRALADVHDPGSSDGRFAEIAQMGSFPPHSGPIATLNVNPFFRPQNDPDTYDPVWQVIVDHRGSLGQHVIETYDWKIAARLRSDTNQEPWWQLRRLEIVTSVEGAASLIIEFDPA